MPQGLPKPASRRPIGARDTAWAAACARRLAAAGASPNAISVASVAFAALAGAALAATGRADGPARAACWIGAAAGIQLRLLCNLFDGMVAVEGGRKTKSGELYNELPDRFSDWAILVGAGHAAGAGPWGPTLGWAAALLAILTAYVRALGAGAGASQHFEGPMAKQHRMAVMTACALASALAAALRLDWPLAHAALWIVVAGCVATAARRAVAIARELEAR